MNSGTASKEEMRKRRQSGLPPINILEWNLRCLAERSDGPEMIVLGEAKESSFSSAVRASLFKNYPFRAEIPYTSLQAKRGFWVLSRIPFEVSAEPLDWVDPKLNAQERRAYEVKWTQQYRISASYMARSFVVITFQQNGKSFRLIPVHLLMPWAVIREHATFGKFSAAFEMIAGTDHPLYHQIKNLKTKIDQLRTKNPRDPVIVMGDFNMPSEFMGIRPKGWSYMIGGHPKHGSVRDAFSNQPPTWPAFFGDQDTSPEAVAIDHALVSPGVRVRAAEVLPFVGSDHYPLFLSVGRE